MKDSTYVKYCLIIDYWFTNGKNGTKAYQKFYPTSTQENAAVRFLDIVRNDKVSEYVKTKEQTTSNELGITLSKQLKRLNDIIDSDCRESDKINAIKEQNKLLALYEEHNNQKASTLTVEKVNINFEDKR
tara:strand:- start:22 stop:411 length:390 start_codon:yes stop_codon:yes gene_type:complete